MIIKNETRAGTYESQPGGYKAFIPAPLPPEPPIRLSSDMQILLSQADRALGRLDGSIEILPDADLFVAMYIRKEAVLSSQIEGTQSSLQDVLAAEAKMLSPDRPRDVDEVFNYINAMNYGLERIKAIPISVRLIREIHEKLLSGVRGHQRNPGELRKIQNWIGPSGCTLKEAIFVPPPPQIVPEVLNNLEKFLHEEHSLPLLIKVGVAHSQFETIHPFLDGNGRIGRLLITLLLCERQVLKKPVLYLSYYFKKYRQEYYDKLQAVRDEGDWESWLEFFLRGILEVSNSATQTAKKILQMRENHRKIISEKMGRIAGNGHKVLEYLYRMPICSVPEIQRLIGTSYPAANYLIQRMVDVGILQETTGRRRHRRFIYRSYIDLFHEES
ncbi:Fic family protein [Calditrichota bacterium LG25]